MPWISVSSDPKKVQASKESYVKSLGTNIKDLPKVAQDFIKYAVNLKFDEVPDYDKYKSTFKAELKKAGTKLNFSSASPARGARSTPAKKSPAVKRTKKQKAEESSQSDDEVENSPVVPAKKSRRAPAKSSVDEEKNTPVRGKASKKQQQKAVQADTASEEEDMFAETPSPKKKFKAQVQEIGVQTSPAFVAAAKAARVGEKALAQSEYQSNGHAQQLTPSVLRRPRKAQNEATPKRKGKSSAAGKENGDSCNGSAEISNPTPAMLAIMKRKEKVFV